MSVVKDTGDRALLPPFSPEHQELRATIRRWVVSEILPFQDEWEENREFPRELYTRAGELGFLGLKYPEELGGQGGDYLHDAVWAEELAAAGISGGVGSGLGAHTGIATPPIWKFGTDEQKQRWLVPAIKGEKIAALGITEPSAGSDVAGIRTRAEKVDGGWIVNGSKTFITNGVRADFLVCAVKTTPEGGHHGISFLVLEREMDGYEVTNKLEKMGWHASDTGELSFTDVAVPAENLLGKENGGFYLIMANFQWERLLMALGAVGGMQWCIERTLAYAKEREAFGRPIGKFQTIRHKIAEMAIKEQTGRAMTYNALRLFHHGHDALREVTLAKLFTQRAAVEVADEAVQIHGGYGYMREYHVERALRDARLGPIGGGTDEVMKEIVGRGLGLTEVATAPRLALATCAEVPDLDPEGKLLLAACREAGIETDAAIWNDDGVDWGGFDLVLIRSTWDYKDKPADFRAWTERIGPRLRNAPAIVAWNLSKHYLQILRGWGFPVVATDFLEPGACREEIAGTLPSAGQFVVKPAVSAGSTDTARYVAADPSDRERALGHASELLGDGRTVMVQPFLASVETKAETAVILLAGEPVHAIRKGPLLDVGQGLEKGLFREEDISLRQPHQDELRLAQAIVERFSAEVAAPLYSRVDMLRDDAGNPTVLELELIEPSLTLDYSPSSLARMVELLGDELGAVGG